MPVKLVSVFSDALPPLSPATEFPIARKALVRTGYYSNPNSSIRSISFNLYLTSRPNLMKGMLPSFSLRFNVAVVKPHLSANCLREMNKVLSIILEWDIISICALAPCWRRFGFYSVFASVLILWLN